MTNLALPYSTMVVKSLRLLGLGRVFTKHLEKFGGFIVNFIIPYLSSCLRCERTG
jgi:hypothetical protein